LKIIAATVQGRQRIQDTERTNLDVSHQIVLGDA